jgi:hypothetical protein
LRQPNQQVGVSLRHYLGVVRLVMLLAIGLSLTVLIPLGILQRYWLLVVLVVIGLAAYSMSTSNRAKAEIVGILGSGPVLRPEPSRPQSLDYPVRRIREFQPPPLADPRAPPERVVGGWMHCKICGRPLTDRLSRYRGVGPTCFSRTRIYYPEGPINPDYQTWQRLTEQARARYPARLAKAQLEYEASVQRDRERHERAVHEWEAAAPRRLAVAKAYDDACQAWGAERERHIAEMEAWQSHPLQRVRRLHASHGKCWVVLGALAAYLGLFPGQ